MKIKDMTDDELRILIIESLHQDKPSPQPRTPRLVEAVGKLLLHLNDYYSGDTLQVCKDRVAVALAAEKKRQELEKKATALCYLYRRSLPSHAREAVEALDTHEKGEAQ